MNYCIVNADGIIENIIVCESDADGVPTPIDGAAAKIYRYGKTYVTMFRLGKEQ